jgi:predicted neuraminidase
MQSRLSLAFSATLLFVVIASAMAEEAVWTDQDLRQQSGVVLVEYIFECASFPECHASTIVETPDGLVAAWFGGTHEKHPDVGIWLSRQEQGRWTPPLEVANGIQSPTLRYPTWNPVLFQTRDREVRLFYKVGPSPSSWWGMMKTSRDNGQTWSEVRQLPDGILGPMNYMKFLV